MPPKIGTVGAPRIAEARASETKAERDRFYAGSRWRKLRFAYLCERPLCERCEALGVDRAANVVHHRRERLDAPELAYEWDNLESLCHECHTAHHKGRLIWHERPPEAVAPAIPTAPPLPARGPRPEPAEALDPPEIDPCENSPEPRPTS